MVRVDIGSLILDRFWRVARLITSSIIVNSTMYYLTTQVPISYSKILIFTIFFRFLKFGKFFRKKGSVNMVKWHQLFEWLFGNCVWPDFIKKHWKESGISKMMPLRKKVGTFPEDGEKRCQFIHRYIYMYISSKL